MVSGNWRLAWTILGCGIVAGAGDGAVPQLATRARLVDPDVVSTAFGEVRFSRSPDARWAVWGSSDRPGGPGGWEIWLARCAEDRCHDPRVASISSSANDFDPLFAPDGREVYFFSNRPGGAGGDDLWVASFDLESGEFGEPRALGPQVNSPGDEWAPTLSADGLRLLFASDGRGGAGKHDLFVAHRASRDSDDWSAAQPVPGALNTAADEFDAAWLADGRTLVFARSDDAASRPIALYVAQPTTGGGEDYDVGEKLGPELNVEDGWTLGPVRDWAVPERLYLSSHRAEERRGKLDIYVVEWAPAAKGDD